MGKEKDILSWIRERIAFTEQLLAEAKADGNYGKQVYLSAKREAYQELERQLQQENKKVG